jgi:Transposase and inactivated derivatives
MKCSRSGYYSWVNLGRPEFKKYDVSVAKTISKQYSKDNRQGIRRLRMNIKKIYGISYSNSTIYRYMKLLNIESIIRKKKKKYSKVKHHKIPNLIKRDFNAAKPNQKWSIDITYIHTISGVEYLCAIKDMYDKNIISYNQSRFMDNELVLSVVKNAIKVVPYKNRKGLILHSDQGVHFIGVQYGFVLKHNKIKRSCSYKGSCVDNVPIESFFSSLKTECIYLYQNITRELSKLLVVNYIKYYNYDRLQEQLKELTPIQYRNQFYNASF